MNFKNFILLCLVSAATCWQFESQKPHLPKAILIQRYQVFSPAPPQHPNAAKKPQNPEMFTEGQFTAPQKIPQMPEQNGVFSRPNFEPKKSGKHARPHHRPFLRKDDSESFSESWSESSSERFEKHRKPHHRPPPPFEKSENDFSGSDRVGPGRHGDKMRRHPRGFFSAIASWWSGEKPHRHRHPSFDRESQHEGHEFPPKHKGPCHKGKKGKRDFQGKRHEKMVVLKEKPAFVQQKPVKLQEAEILYDSKTPEMREVQVLREQEMSKKMTAVPRD